MTNEERASIADAVRKTLLEQREHKVERGFYWENQIAFAYNSEKMEGNPLSKDQTRSLFETGTVSGQSIPIDAVLETQNHFRLFDFALDTCEQELCLDLIRQMQGILKRGSVSADAAYAQPGEWKTVPNGVGGIQTVEPSLVQEAMERLMDAYLSATASIENIVAFHWRFECIHPFQDGNGRTGRMIMFRECLHHGIDPFICIDELKRDYYLGLQTFAESRTTLLSYVERMQELYFEEFGALVPKNLLLPQLRQFKQQEEAFEQPDDLFS